MSRNSAETKLAIFTPPPHRVAELPISHEKCDINAFSNEIEFDPCRMYTAFCSACDHSKDSNAKRVQKGSNLIYIPITNQQHVYLNI